MIFEVGKYYKHNDGEKIHVLVEVNSDMYFSPCLVAEDLKGNFFPVGIGESYSVNWHEIDETEWLNEMKECKPISDVVKQSNNVVKPNFDGV